MALSKNPTQDRSFRQLRQQMAEDQTKAAGYPDWARTEDQKQQYISQYNEREGIKLEPTMIRKTPGRKATAKLMLNSFWGKFGENLNKPSTLAIDTPATPASLFQVISDPLLRIQSIRICTEDKLEIVHSKVKENQTSLWLPSPPAGPDLNYTSHWRSWVSKPTTLTRIL